MNRRELFTGFLKSKKNESRPIRPPYSSRESDFSSCRECDAPCVQACETSIIKRDKEGKPFLDFSIGGCSYCGKCVEVCPEGVLSVEKEQRIRAKVEIFPQRCSAWSGVLCFSCKEPCLDNAIKFQGLYKPVVVESKCTACGFCISVCPTGAIGVKVYDS